MKSSQKFYLPLKRLIGIVGSFVGIIFCFVLLWWWVTPVNSIVTKGHPFFTSDRVGQNGKHFKCLKFRTMKIGVNPEMTSREKVDTTNISGKFGKFLRISSIDETLQLLNIFIGQMAFIGPRPLIYVSGDKTTIDKRIEDGSIILKPGLGGYAQLHERAELDPIKKAEYDYYYFQHFSLWLDIKIFCLTVVHLFGIGKGK